VTSIGSKVLLGWVSDAFGAEVVVGAGLRLSDLVGSKLVVGAVFRVERRGGLRTRPPAPRPLPPPRPLMSLASLLSGGWPLLDGVRLRLDGCVSRLDSGLEGPGESSSECV
jgi:hypothetical protein